MSTPQISVVMSVYNGEPYLHEAVESILCQSFTDFEFVVIDDGSTDGTKSILSTFALHDPRIILVRGAENVGYTRRLNEGISYARGMYIARQDADDISLPERLARQVTFLEEYPNIGMVGTLPQFIDSHGALIVDSHYVCVTDNDQIQNRLLDSNCFHHGSVMMRRQLLELAGPYDVELEPSEDYDLWLRLAEITQLANLDQRLYLYREQSNSVSSKRRFQQMRNKAIALERAIYRRYGPRPTSDALDFLARDFFRAAILGYVSGDSAAAQDCLTQARNYDPSLLNNTTLVAEWIRKYMPHHSTSAASDYIERLFSGFLPKSYELSRMKARLLSELHMGEVFAGLKQNHIQRINDHLWLGIRNDPSWLFNRSVASLVARRFAHVIGLAR